MKKLLSFLRSMTFGMILLLIILALSFAGSMIPQERTSMEYVNRFGATWAQVILTIRLDDVFHSVYFILLEGLLALNLILCSVSRVRKVRKAKTDFAIRAATAPVSRELTPERAEWLRTALQKRRWKSVETEGKTVYIRHQAGFYGSFLTHLAILAVLVVGGAVLTLPQITDRTVMPGETITLEDGSRVTVESFHIEDETGKLDYASRLSAQTPDGMNLEGEIRVNEPMRVGEYKIYQQTYGTAGRIRIENHGNGATDTLYLTEPCFLSIDGKNGVFFRALYPGYVQSGDGEMTLITSTSGEYTDPVYEVQSIVDGMATPVLAFPGETITVGDVSFTFTEPAAYPGLRIKRVPGIVMGLLYATFAFMVVALAICFFVTPAALRIEDEGVALVSPKESARMELEMMLEEDEE